MFIVPELEPFIAPILKTPAVMRFISVLVRDSIEEFSVPRLISRLSDNGLMVTGDVSPGAETEASIAMVLAFRWTPASPLRVNAPVVFKMSDVMERF
jgi:hypothetical protein